ncbi:hypothetical protein, partial [Enteractinococcus helveticum]|uniref:hypothetical protein n=1 Tax=Enteractinococcus helveticum TaxID=1837282 RepID=UPI001F42F594
KSRRLGQLREEQKTSEKERNILKWPLILEIKIFHESQAVYQSTKESRKKNRIITYEKKIKKIII